MTATPTIKNVQYIMEIIIIIIIKLFKYFYYADIKWKYYLFAQEVDKKSIFVRKKREITNDISVVRKIVMVLQWCKKAEKQK